MRSLGGSTETSPSWSLKDRFRLRNPSFLYSSSTEYSSGESPAAYFLPHDQRLVGLRQDVLGLDGRVLKRA